ncbi:hypothetical protein [Amycolatopsis sp. NPDC059657]|uniref:hypothetical protein n=1 Tax=Amycolatopsis sp. NPDC059657 TaxID=3346899 RepID=UPI00366F0122
MARRRTRLDWRALLAAAGGLAVLLVGIDLDFGFVTSVFLALVAAAMAFAALRARGRPRQVTRAATPNARPRIVVGHDVVTLCPVGGGSVDVIPQGSRGRVTGSGWGTFTVAFTVHGPLGIRVVPVQVRPEQVDRI